MNPAKNGQESWRVQRPRDLALGLDHLNVNPAPPFLAVQSWLLSLSFPNRERLKLWLS